MSLSLEREFVDLLKKIFTHHGYEVTANLRSYRRRNFSGLEHDLVITKGGQGYIVDAKIYRSTTISPVIVRNALEALEGTVKEAGADKGICVVPIPLKLHRYHNFSRIPMVEIWDLNKLSELTAGNSDLAGQLARFLRQAGIVAAVDEENVDTIEEISSRASEEFSKNTGEMLALEIETCPVGRKSAQAFEKYCEGALRFLFNDQVGKWTAQRSASDGMHRYDLIARIEPTHSFWIGLLRDFRSRYVIFEFKNYSAKIGQDQVYTTEKYLYVTALRVVSIIVSRKGLDRNGLRAVQGALREHGKLIINITSDELCSVLRDKDQGNDPTNLLIDKLDSLLTEIGR